MTVSSRRAFVRGLVGGVGATALGFDPVLRTWVSTAHAQTPGTISIPQLDGALFTDSETRAEYADDFGNVVHRTPLAVLQPGSIQDVIRAIRFCRSHRIQVAARGQGHSTAGQSQVQGGLVIDMSTLREIEEQTQAYVVVQGGALWRELLADLIPRGLRPPVVTSFAGLSVGGTLSMGGIGGASFSKGAQVDNVLELEVVTGEGKLEVCSPTRKPMLFNAVLGGMGQFGVIVRAKLPLVQALPLARNYIIPYFDSATFFADMETLTSSGKIDSAYGQLSPESDGSWIYLIIAVKFYSPAAPPVDADILDGLNFPPPALQVMDMDSYSSDTMVDSQLEFLKSIGLYDIPHVWSDVFLPDSKVRPFVDQALREFTPADLGPAGFVLLFPIKNRIPDAQSLRLPRERKVWLFDVLSSGFASDPTYAATQIAKARALFERARAVGGTLYPIGSTPMSRQDWIRQFGLLYALACIAKAAYDPARILTPGIDVF